MCCLLPSRWLRRFGYPLRDGYTAARPCERPGSVRLLRPEAHQGRGRRSVRNGPTIVAGYLHLLRGLQGFSGFTGSFGLAGCSQRTGIGAAWWPTPSSLTARTETQ